MEWTHFILLSKKQITPDTYIFRFQPQLGRNFSFVSGQYVFIKNPAYLPAEMHPFSIASSPDEEKYLEFCIKVYGDWTDQLSKLRINSPVQISQPTGNFTWQDDIRHGVFLLGGIGIAPIISMVRSFKKPFPFLSLTILYGNRTPESSAYSQALARLQNKLPLHVIYIYSDLPPDSDWQGYKGFITKEIIEREVNLSTKPTFFIVGPPIFLKKMYKVLELLNVQKTYIKNENLDIVRIVQDSKEI